MKTNWVERLWIDGPWRIPFQVHEIRYFKNLCGIAPRARILEIGCGRGAGARMIRREYAPRRIDAIDIDPDMIRRAERHPGAAGDDSIHFQVADAQHLPFADRSMDAVFNFGIIHHLEDWRQGIREIARVLKPGGLFFFEEIFPALYAGFILRWVLVHPREDRFDGPQYRGELEAAGIRLMEGYRESRYTILGAGRRE